MGWYSKQVIIAFAALLLFAASAFGQPLQPEANFRGLKVNGVDITEAAGISFTPSGNLEGEDVNAVIIELDTEKLPATHTSDANPHTQYVFSETSAGAPAAGSCDQSGQITTDTTNEIPYFCSDGAGGNPRSFATLGDAYSQVSDGSNSATASGGETLKFEDTSEIDFTVTAGSPDKVTAAIVASSIATTKLANHVKSIYIPAGAMTVSGTCTSTEPTLETIVASGPKRYTITPADGDTCSVEFDWVMPDAYNAGTITVEMHAFSTTSQSTVLELDFAGQSVRDGDAVAAHSTTGEQAATCTFESEANEEQHCTTAAITLNGTPAAGAHVYMRGQVDATATTGTVTNYRILGVKIEYTVTGGGSD